MRNTLDAEDSTQFVMTMCSQQRFLSFSRRAEPRMAIASSPVSMMQSDTVTRRQVSMSNPSVLAA